MTETEAAIATLFVPMVPSPPDRSSRAAWDRWARWLWRTAHFRDFRRFRRVDVPCRVVATVRIPVDSRGVLDSPATARWRDAIRAAASRTLVASPDLLRGVEVAYEPLFDVPAIDRPLVEGTEMVFIEEVGE